jgi:hypothetical protein
MRENDVTIYTTISSSTFLTSCQNLNQGVLTHLPTSCHTKRLNSGRITIKCKALVQICISVLRHAEGCSPKWEQKCTISSLRTTVGIQGNTFLMQNACYSRYGATLETNGPWIGIFHPELETQLRVIQVVKAPIKGQDQLRVSSPLFGKIDPKKGASHQFRW